MSSESPSKARISGPTPLFIIFALVLLVAGACSDAPGTREGPERREGRDRPPLATIVGTEVHTLSSTVRRRDYRISVALPLSYGETDAEYPVIYVLDADFSFGVSISRPQWTSVPRR